MKLTNVLSVFLVMAGVAAQAIVAPRWERPILKAQLTELDADGSEFEVISLGRAFLTMNKRDGSKVPTSLTFTESFPIRCLRAPGIRCPGVSRKVMNFRIVKREQVGCGDFVISAVEVRKGPDFRHMPLQPISEIELLDRTKHTCRDLIKYRWELDLTTAFSTLTSGGESVRHFGGNPEEVITIQ